MKSDLPQFLLQRYDYLNKLRSVLPNIYSSVFANTREHVRLWKREDGIMMVGCLFRCGRGAVMTRRARHSCTSLSRSSLKILTSKGAPPATPLCSCHGDVISQDLMIPRFIHSTAMLGGHLGEARLQNQKFSKANSASGTSNPGLQFVGCLTCRQLVLEQPEQEAREPSPEPSSQHGSEPAISEGEPSKPASQAPADEEGGTSSPPDQENGGLSHSPSSRVQHACIL